MTVSRALPAGARARTAALRAQLATVSAARLRSRVLRLPASVLQRIREDRASHLPTRAYPRSTRVRCPDTPQTAIAGLRQHGQRPRARGRIRVKIADESRKNGNPNAGKLPPFSTPCAPAPWSAVLAVEDATAARVLSCPPKTSPIQPTSLSTPMDTGRTTITRISGEKSRVGSSCRIGPGARAGCCLRR